VAYRHDVDHEHIVREEEPAARPSNANLAVVVLGVVLALLIVLLLLFGLSHRTERIQAPARPAPATNSGGGTAGSVS
jgi:hypothetical protein